MKTIYVVTHGSKSGGANPPMNETGFDENRALRARLPKNPPEVVCGTGRRHLDVATALGLEPTRYSGLVGSPDSLETVEGGKKMIILADGTAVDPNSYTTLADGASALAAIINHLSDEAVVCAGRPSMIMLGVKDAKSAAVYCITCEDGQIISIEELVAQGVSETGTV